MLARGKLLDWAADAGGMGVRANADTPEDAITARRFQAQGIGLCRTEHMFFDGERLPEEGKALAALRADFDRRITAILDEAGLSVPEVLGAWGGDRSGQFSEQRGHILAEMQVLARRHPGATW